MIRKATHADVERIAEIYEAIHTEEEAGRASIGWVRGVYPTKATAEAAVKAGDMYVQEDGGKIVASARINREQVAEYADAAWAADAPEDRVMVLHTLTVDPALQGRGYGPKFVEYYEQYALAQGCPFLRMDTNEKNRAARALYAKLGYREADVVLSQFNGIADVRLVCLEKTLEA